MNGDFPSVKVASRFFLCRDSVGDSTEEDWKRGEKKEAAPLSKIHAEQNKTMDLDLGISALYVR